MTDKRGWKNSRGAIAAGAAVLVALGAAGGAGAVQLTRPAIEMAPTTRTAIAKLPASNGVVTVKGRVADVFGDRFVVQDATGRALVAAGRDAPSSVRVGQPVMVQGRFGDGQLRASYLVDQNGDVSAIGPRGPQPGQPPAPPPHGPGRGPNPDGPPPPPPGCAPTPGAPGGPGAVPPPPPPAGDAGQTPGRVAPPPPPAAQQPFANGGVPTPAGPARPQG